MVHWVGSIPTSGTIHNSQGVMDKQKEGTTMAINRTDEYSYEMLNAQTDAELKKEYKYRLRKTAPKSFDRERLIREILHYVGTTGNGPEMLKDKLGAMFNL